MKDLVHPGNTGDLNAALELVQSELDADADSQSVLAVKVWSTWQLVAAIDRLAAARHSS